MFIITKPKDKRAVLLLKGNNLTLFDSTNGIEKRLKHGAIGFLNGDVLGVENTYFWLVKIID